MRIMLFTLASAFAIVCSSAARAGVVSSDGTEEGFWDHHAVVVCEFNRIPDDPRRTGYPVTIRAVLATDFLVPTQMVVRGDINAPDSGLRVKVLPSQGTVALLCVRVENGQWVLPREILTFLPTGSALIPVKGLDDPLLRRIEARVREARKGKKTETDNTTA